MKIFTYHPGGIHPKEEKYTKSSPLAYAPIPDIVVIPLLQHTGAPNNPTVKIGDKVRIGEVIGNSTAAIAAPIHSSVSGEVIGIEDRITPSGIKSQSIIIRNDFKEEWVELNPITNFENLSRDEILSRIRNAGVVGLGGASFPTAVKLSPPQGKIIDTVIGNGAECELFLTIDHRTMLEFPDKIIDGILIEIKLLGAKRGIIAIENNKTDAAEILEKRLVERRIQNIEVVLVKTKYPQGGEKQLIKAVLGREVPSGGLPFEVGVVVQNVGTLKAISEAVLEGKPLIERGVTISGPAAQKSGNYIVRIGTLAKDLIDFVGLKTDLRKLIFGGPMTGIAQPTVDVPVVKGTSGILLFGEEAFTIAPEEESPCIRCSSCVDHCPTGLMPVLIDHAIRKNDLKLSEKLHAMDCIECGVCSYVCPAKRHLTENIKKAKQGILKQRKIEAAKKAAFEKLKAQREKKSLEKEVKQ